MRRLYGRVKLMTWVSVPCAAAVPALLSMFLFHWTQDLVLALALFLAMSCFAVTRFLLFMGKVQIIRQEVTNESGGHCEH
jgi:hypothetical protein